MRCAARTATGPEQNGNRAGCSITAILSRVASQGTHDAVDKTEPAKMPHTSDHSCFNGPLADWAAWRSSGGSAFTAEEAASFTCALAPADRSWLDCNCSHALNLCSHGHKSGSPHQSTNRSLVICTLLYQQGAMQQDRHHVDLT